MDALTFDAAVATCIVVGIALRSRTSRIRRVAFPATVDRGLMRRVRRRHRRVARAILKLAHECLERHPDGSLQAFTARETLRSYLPDTLAAYLAVPRRLRRVRRAGRPSADDELSRQLWTLHQGLERVAEADGDAGAAQLAANGAFLRERFDVREASRLPGRQSTLGNFVEVVQTALRRP